MFSGIKFVESPFCTTEKYRFPPSKNRSRRLHKKLVKLHGAYIYREPAAYMVSGQLVAHPEIIKKMAEAGQIVRMA